jgi:DnaK suppressor protein
MTRMRIAIADVPVGEQRHEIRRMLLEHRRELLNDIHSRIRDAREDKCGTHDHTDEPVNAEPEDDLTFALIDMKTQALHKINESVRRLDEGTYGYCADCSQVIAPSRLRAMPFAVRCRDCEATRECTQHRERFQSQRLLLETRC